MPRMERGAARGTPSPSVVSVVPVRGGPEGAQLVRDLPADEVRDVGVQVGGGVGRASGMGDGGAGRGGLGWGVVVWGEGAERVFYDGAYCVGLTWLFGGMVEE